MSKAKITLNGMYNYDKTLFNDIQLPVLVNKENLINHILLEYGEFEVLYPFSDFLKNSVNHFFSLNYNLFNRWAETLAIEYDPLENFNRHEEWSDEKENTESAEERESASNSINDRINQTDGLTSTTTTTSSGTTSQTNQISSFDATTLVDDSSSSGSAQSTASDSVTNSETHTSNDTKTETNQLINNKSLDAGENLEHTGHMWGNIGVTTSQQMLEAEMEVREKWQLEKIIADMFAENLLVLVYD